MKQFSLWKYPKTGRHPGFSLVEMLMALLVASLLLAALAPVMTKRVTNEVIGVSGMGGIIKPPAGSYCWSLSKGGGSESIVTDENGNRVIKYTPETGVYYLNFALASGGGGGGGASEAKNVADHFTGVNGAKLKIEANMTDFDIVSLIGGGGGGGGGASVDRSTTCPGAVSESKCGCMGFVYDGAGLCVSEKIGSATFNNASNLCTNAPTTTLPKDSNGAGWRLPTKDEISRWTSIYPSIGITNGNKTWTNSTAQGACSSYASKYSCTCEGTARGDYATASDCCSGCGWGAQKPTVQGGATSNGGSYTLFHCDGNTYTRTESFYWVWCSKGCYTSGTWTSDGCKSNGAHCGANGYGSFVRCDYITPSNASKYAIASSPGDTCSATSYQQCNSYHTNYYYGMLSGSSWNTAYDEKTSPASTGSYDVHCVYGGTGTVGAEAFYSLSGGGGGAAPAIQNNNFDSNVLTTFRQKIYENIGGYIVLQVGNGGKGGPASTDKGQRPLTDGKHGADSCIAITKPHSTTAVVYKICVPGGKAGTSGDGTITNASTQGYGKKGPEIAINAHACYAVDYSSNASGITTKFDCTKKGNEGTDGGASTAKPTPGGKGGASPLNDTQAGGTPVVGGVSASSTNYGAGGGGGSATKTGVGTGGTLSFGAGGDGANGYIYLNFNRRFDAAGGGGGGAGSVAFIKEYRISGGGDSECTFVVGKAGSGGSINSDGIKGGDTSVSCTKGGGEIFKVFGGEGGKSGTTAQNADEQSKGGDGGLHGGYSTDIESLSTSKVESKTGYDGTKGGDNNDSNYTNYVQSSYSAGGRGGSVIAGLYKGGCGALQNDVVCNYNTDIVPNVSELIGASIPVDDLKFPEVAIAENYGNFGRGGGGGGWHIQKGSGKGGDGLGGYACIWWDKVE